MRLKNGYIRVYVHNDMHMCYCVLAKVIKLYELVDFLFNCLPRKTVRANLIPLFLRLFYGFIYNYKFHDLSIDK